MKWTQVKKRIEGTFAESVRGRVEVWATRYRGAHDQAGRCWVNFDQRQIISMADLTFRQELEKEHLRLCDLGNCRNYKDPTKFQAYLAASDQARKNTDDLSIFYSPDVIGAFRGYMNMDIDAAHASDCAIQRAFSLLDYRFGKRRLTAFDPADKHPMVQKLYAVRCLVEGLPSHLIQSLILDESHVLPLLGRTQHVARM